METLLENSKKLQSSLAELTGLGRIVFQEFSKIFEKLKSGRSPLKINFEEEFETTAPSLQAFEESLKQGALSLKDFSLQALKLPSPQQKPLLGQIALLKKELEFWKKYLDLSRTLNQRLELASQETQISPYLRGTIDELWAELQKMPQQ